MRLSSRLVIRFLLISLIPLGIIGYFGYRNGIKTIKQDTMERLTAINVLKAAEVNRWIYAAKSQLETLAQRPLVRIYASILVNGSSEPQEVKSAISNLLKDHFKPHISERGGFLDLFILSRKDGRIVAATLKHMEGKYRENRPFFIEGQNYTYVDDMIYEVGIEQLVMHTSTPIKGSDGRTIAVLAGHMDWREMSQIMAKGFERSTSVESYLVNKYNYFVTESRFAGGYPFIKTIHTEGVERCLAKKNGVDLYDGYRGFPTIGAFQWMPEWNLCILTEENPSEAFAPAVAFRNIFAAVGLVTVLAAILFSVFFARTIANRIQRLVTGAEEIGKGNLYHRIDARGDDEIDRLARSFNKMAHARMETENIIRKSRDELEKRVRERTAEITLANENLRKEIVERKQIEEALRESEEKYRELVENIDTAVVVHGDDSRILLSNPRAQELLGLNGERLTENEPVDQLWHLIREDGTHMPLEEYPVNRVINSNASLDNYTAGIHRPEKDSIIWVSMSAFPKLDSKGQLKQVVVTFYDITYRKEAQSKLQSSLSEKEVLLREIHHRVKNNMQMIQSMINLQARKLDHPEDKKILMDSKSRIKSMALIHETLYRSEDMARLNLKKYFRELVKQLLRLYRHSQDTIQIDFDIEALVLDMDSSIACGLIVNELVTNALKYAFGKSSEARVTIALRRLDNKIAEMVVADNGKGLPSLDNTHHSLGLKIVSMLAEDQLHGKMDINIDSGTHYRITFPI